MTIKTFNLRLPEPLYDEIKAEAQASERSMNALMVERLNRPLYRNLVTSTGAQLYVLDREGEWIPLNPA